MDGCAKHRAKCVCTVSFENNDFTFHTKIESNQCIDLFTRMNQWKASEGKHDLKPRIKKKKEAQLQNVWTSARAQHSMDICLSAL